MIIEAHNLSKRYARHEAVHSLNLAVPQGAAYALIGENGAGKTTTLRMLVNILQPDAGDATILGIDSRRLTHRHFQRIGFVSENTVLPDRLTVEQYFAAWRPFYTSWDRVLENQLRSALELPADRMLSKLSHGMRMKLMLAGALAFRPQVLVLDEPLSGLDPLVRDEVLERIVSQADETTILISSHELTDIEGFTTHVGFMNHGRLLFQEPIDTLVARFREVRVTLALGAAPRCELPCTWLSPEVSGQALRFVATSFRSEGDLANELATVVGRVEHFEAAPLSLREISKALMRASRGEAKT